MNAETRLVRAMRLRHQGLAGAMTSWESVADVARGMLAVQAQDAKGVLWARSIRSAADPDEATTAEAFEQGEVVRNRPSRGTLQATLAEDMGWLSALLSTRSRAAAAKRRGQIGLGDEMLEAATRTIVSELADGGPLTRPELVEACSRAGVDLDGAQAGHVLRHLTEGMDIVFAGAPGRVDSFTAGAPVVSAGREVSGDEALAELAVRYFGARGPATAQCLSWWADLTMGDVRKGIAAAGDELETVHLAGEEFVVPAGSADLSNDQVDRTLAEPLLLAPFDEYLLGYRSRDAVITPEHLDAVVPGRNGMFKPIVVVEGEVVGIWSRKATKRAVTVTVEPFAELSADSVEGLEQRAVEYGEFLGLEPEPVICKAN